MKDMRARIKHWLIGIGVVGGIVLLCGYVIPAVIKGGFWVFLQMMYYPVTTIVVIMNLLVWQYIYIIYTERKTTENLDN
jgi:hypothetical protein